MVELHLRTFSIYSNADTLCRHSTKQAEAQNRFFQHRNALQQKLAPPAYADRSFSFMQTGRYLEMRAVCPSAQADTVGFNTGT